MTAELPPADPFAEAAEFYFHRPPYPAPAIQWLCDQLHLDGNGRMLDVGCGTGHACFCFAGRFAQIIGIDPSQPMLDQAHAIAAARGWRGFEFKRMSAEDLPAGLGTFRLITFGASFHRTVRQLVVEIAYDMLEPAGALGLLFPSTPWGGESPWQETLRRTVRDWTGTGLAGPSECNFEPSQAIFRRSRFGRCREEDFREHHVWSVPELIGYLKSTSFCSPAVLGERATEFEHELTARLRQVQPDGRFEDVLETAVALAVKA